MTHRLAARIISVSNSRSDGSIGSQESTLDQTPEVEDPRGTTRTVIAALIDTGRCVRIPAITERLVIRVERRVRCERRRAPTNKCVARGHLEAVSIRCDAQHNLVWRESGFSPRLNSTDSRALLVRRARAGIVQRGIGADGGGP